MSTEERWRWKVARRILAVGDQKRNTREEKSQSAGWIGRRRTELTLEVEERSLKIGLARRRHEFLKRGNRRRTEEEEEAQLGKKSTRRRQKKTDLNVLPHVQLVEIRHELVELFSVAC